VFIVSIIDPFGSLVDIASLYRDFIVEPEIVASEIDRHDPFRLPFFIKNNSSWWTLYDVNPTCIFDATTDCYEMTNAHATGNIPGLLRKGDIETGKQVPFLCNIWIPEQQYRSLRVGMFVAYGMRPFLMWPIKKREAYAEFFAIWDSTNRPQWVPGPMLGDKPRPFERRKPPPGEELALSMNFRGTPGCMKEGTGFFVR
jgi:hypothetical protein